MNEIDIKLSDRPDGYGLYYGEARKGDAVVRVNVLPPAHLWAGDIELDGFRPDPTHWQVYADGELLARIERQEDVGASLLPLLTSGPVKGAQMDISLIFGWVGLCIAVGILANRYGRSGFGWFILSMVLSPLLGVAFVLALGRRAAAS